jgi:hypothetical protein
MKLHENEASFGEKTSVKLLEMVQAGKIKLVCFPFFLDFFK